MQQLGLWAFSRLLPVYTGEHSKNLARSMRRRFAALGVFFGAALVLTLWDSTGSLVLCAVVGVAIVLGLYFYSEHAHRQA